MNPRELRIALALTVILIAGGGALVFAKMGKWKQAIEQKEAQLTNDKAVAEELLKQQDFWKTRSEWLAAKQPVWTSRKSADDELYKLVNESAQKEGVTLLGTQQVNPEQLPGVMAAGLVIAEAKAPMGKMLRWLTHLQMPEGHDTADSFISIKGLTMKPDPEDTAIVHVSDFHIQKWYRTSGTEPADTPATAAR